MYVLAGNKHEKSENLRRCQYVNVNHFNFQILFKVPKM